MTRDKSHDHYWVSSGVLFESYSTIRGLRYRAIDKVKLPDCDRCTDEMIASLGGK
jgi:hypothetical protein